MVGLKPFCWDTLQCYTLWKLWIMKNSILLTNSHSAPNRYTFFRDFLRTFFKIKSISIFFSNFKTAIIWHCDNHFWSFFCQFFLSCILMTMIDFPETVYFFSTCSFWVALFRQQRCFYMHNEIADGICWQWTIFRLIFHITVTLRRIQTEIRKTFFAQWWMMCMRIAEHRLIILT